MDAVTIAGLTYDGKMSLDGVCDLENQLNITSARAKRINRLICENYYLEIDSLRFASMSATVLGGLMRAASTTASMCAADVV